MKDNINERLSTEQSWLLGGKDQFADLMVGRTRFMKNQSEAEARARREEEQKVLEAKRREIEENLMKELQTKPKATSKTKRRLNNIKSTLKNPITDALIKNPITDAIKKPIKNTLKNPLRQKHKSTKSPP